MSSVICPDCRGSGFFEQEKKALACKYNLGSQKFRFKICKRCNGTGIIKKKTYQYVLSDDINEHI